MVRYLLIVPVTLAVLFGSLWLDDYVLTELLERCPTGALVKGGDSTPPSCLDTRYSDAIYLATLVNQLLTVALMVGSAALLAPHEKFAAALFVALFGTWLLLTLAMVVSYSDSSFERERFHTGAAHMVVVASQ